MTRRLFAENDLVEDYRSPLLRLIVALIFAAPAAVAGYALVQRPCRSTSGGKFLHRRRRIRWRRCVDATGSGLGQPAR